ncbi:hypothetical protein THAOC_07797 [Thalassiosira oceanica]|uniref:Uncharacterized protein n=1 Tax=Thalassiosira oceanica TaxID=159749 RepID=K0SZF5_THAOC|nr:hypothetical protein THAOC_07797 [Thalassiosira oceanica]|eukprot:EJK70815.1 hypothetical protein THAOC_07797 [Thalassiosira oceanica]
MPPKRSSGSSSSKPQAKKKKKEQRTLTGLFGTGGSVDSEVAVLNKLHEGKRLLIPASGVYSSESDIPPAEKKYLFVYSFGKIHPGGDKATLKSKYIEEGGSQWVNYADTATEDADIDSELINYDYKKNLAKTRDTTLTSARLTRQRGGTKSNQEFLIFMAPSSLCPSTPCRMSTATDLPPVRPRTVTKLSTSTSAKPSPLPVSCGDSNPQESNDVMFKPA